MITHRKAVFNDALFLWHLRNDEGSRKASVHQEEIGLRTHLSWLESYLLTNQIWIFERGKVPVGSVRVGDKGELSWIVSPLYRGCGIGAEMVKTIAYKYRSCWAAIKPENAASKKIAQRAGMMFDSVDDGVEIWRKLE